jgi:hypothetical protein
MAQKSVRFANLPMGRGLEYPRETDSERSKARDWEYPTALYWAYRKGPQTNFHWIWRGGTKGNRWERWREEMLAHGRRKCFFLDPRRVRSRKAPGCYKLSGRANASW